MTTFSAPLTSSITSSDSITLTDTITLNTGTDSVYYYTGNGVGGSSDTITISGGGYAIGGSMNTGTINTVSIGGAGSGFNWSIPKEWDGCFPEWQRIQDMCKQYPALQIAFEKFKTTYKLVKDHYDTPEDQRPLP